MGEADNATHNLTSLPAAVSHPAIRQRRKHQIYNDNMNLLREGRVNLS